MVRKNRFDLLSSTHLGYFRGNSSFEECKISRVNNALSDHKYERLYRCLSVVFSTLGEEHNIFRIRVVKVTVFLLRYGTLFWFVVKIALKCIKILNNVIFERYSFLMAF